MKTIFTHKQPDLDAIVSAWLAQKYLFGREQATVIFVGRSLSRAQMDAADCVVDVGNAYDPECLWFDHKPPAFADRNATCATKLVWEHLLRLKKDVAHLQPLVQVTFEGDTRRWSEALKESRRNGAHATLKRYARESAADSEVYARMTAWLCNYAASLAPEYREEIVEQKATEMAESAMISFQALISADFPLLLTWLAKPHVKEWWDDGDDTLEKVAQHYGEESGTKRFRICCQADEGASAIPIGYLQTYVVEDGGMGIDLFLGEERFLNRGLGTQALQAFIQQVIEQSAPSYFVIDPDPKNTRAIRCYEKVGFRHTETILTQEGKSAYMMRFVP